MEKEVRRCEQIAKPDKRSWLLETVVAAFSNGAVR